jgi:hypothetical protein
LGVAGERMSRETMKGEPMGTVQKEEQRTMKLNM